MVCGFSKAFMIKKLKNEIQQWRTNLINVEKTWPTSKNKDRFLCKTIYLYNKGFYESALAGFEKLSNFDFGLKVYILPQTELCKKAVEKAMTRESKANYVNKIISERFFGLEVISIILAALLFFLVLLKGEEELSFLDIVSKQPQAFLCFALLAFVIISLHFRIKGSSYSIFDGTNMVRCKYCGNYFEFISSMWSGTGCEKCGRSDAVPRFSLDGWNSFIEMEKQTKMDDVKKTLALQSIRSNFYDEYVKWKSKEFGIQEAGNIFQNKSLEELLNNFYEEYNVWKKTKTAGKNE